MVQLSNERSIDGAERQRRRSEARRLEILRAAAQTFREHGFAGAGMRDIASRADLSPGNLYHYFRSKHEILYFCQDRWLAHMLDVLREVRGSDLTAAEQLHRMLITHVRYLLDEVEGSAAHLEPEALPLELRQRIIERRDRYESGLRRIVAAGIRAGEFVPCDGGLTTRAILGAVNWTARWFKPGGRTSAGTVATAVADYLVRGLLAAPPEKAAADRGDSE